MSERFTTWGEEAGERVVAVDPEDIKDGYEEDQGELPAARLVDSLSIVAGRLMRARTPKSFRVKQAAIQWLAMPEHATQGQVARRLGITARRFRSVIREIRGLLKVPTCYP